MQSKRVSSSRSSASSLDATRLDVRRPRRRSARRCCCARPRRRRRRARCAPAGRRVVTSRAGRPRASPGAASCGRKPAAPCASRSWRRSSVGEREHRQVARARVALEPAERLGLLVVAEAEQDHVRAVLLGERERRRRAHGHEALEARRAGDVEPGGGAVDVGVGDQHDAIALGDLLAVVAEQRRAPAPTGPGAAPRTPARVRLGVARAAAAGPPAAAA